MLHTSNFAYEHLNFEHFHFSYVFGIFRKINEKWPIKYHIPPLTISNKNTFFFFNYHCCITVGINFLLLNYIEINKNVYTFTTELNNLSNIKISLLLTFCAWKYATVIYATDHYKSKKQLDFIIFTNMLKIIILKF